MTTPWQRFRDRTYVDVETGFRLDLSRMDIPEQYEADLAPDFERAFDEMEALERGEIANPDEDRRVGHYWLRAPELAPDAGIAEAITRAREDVRSFAARLHDGTVAPPSAERFASFLLVGIGGSALGPQLVADALGGDDRLAPHFLDNTDPAGIERTLGRIRPAENLVIVVSKSGSTPETRNGMLETEAYYRAHGLELGPHAVAITRADSKLDRFAAERSFLARFPMWDWVGGRTSVLSAVGLLPAAAQGVDIDELLGGAAEMDRRTRVRNVRANPAALLALAWHHAGRGRGTRDMVVLPYRDSLSLFSRYLQQLVMESLGKEKNLEGEIVHQGIAVYGNKGSTDQHAYVQQLRDGVPNFFATFVEVLESGRDASIEVEPGVTSADYLQGFLIGTRRALHDNGRPSLTLTIPRVDARNLGGIIALYERAVSLYAGLVRVNAYHQPGVEAGKKAAARVLDLQASLLTALADRDEGGTAEALAAAAGAPDETETVFCLLERLARDPSRGLEKRPGSGAFDAIYRLPR